MSYLVRNTEDRYGRDVAHLEPLREKVFFKPRCTTKSHTGLRSSCLLESKMSQSPDKTIPLCGSLRASDKNIPLWGSLRFSVSAYHDLSPRYF